MSKHFDFSGGIPTASVYGKQENQVALKLNWVVSAGASFYVSISVSPILCRFAYAAFFLKGGISFMEQDYRWRCADLLRVMSFYQFNGDSARHIRANITCIQSMSL